ncbi:MAG: hypothetical protein JOZ81_32065, partial [Chloroflexi bacterium]|nr:hypothetical protein [Chloroflexota bacterium]
AVLATVQAVSTQAIAMVHGTPAVIPTFGPTVVPNRADAWWNQEAAVDPQMAAQIEQAYNHFWDVRSVAMYTMDGSGLPDVMDGEPLQYLLDFMDSLRAQNKAVAIIVEHNARVRYASADEAAVEDHYINHSIDIDPVTKEPMEDPPTESYVYDYRMHDFDGVWKVVETIRIDNE